MRLRGTAQQLFEKYLQLGRDATGAGDRVMAESYFQHAEHYFRILNAMSQAQQQQMQQQQRRQPGGPPGMADMEGADTARATSPRSMAMRTAMRWRRPRQPMATRRMGRRGRTKAGQAKAT